MLKKIIHAAIRPRHPWRDMKFDELAEIYTSMSLRSFGFGIIGIFVPVYLYTSGVSLQGVFLFLTLFFVFRIPTAFLSAYIVGRVGPKHAIAVSTVLIVSFLGMLLTYDLIGWPLAVLSLVFTAANGLFFIAYHVDFSKIKDKKHGGKELGWLIIFEQIGRALGPIVGGVLAGVFAPEVTLGVAIVVLLGSLMPLFLTKEPVKVHQKVSFKGFSPLQHIKDYAPVGALNVSNVSAGAYWPLLAAVLIFTDDTYTKLGVMVGVSTAVSIFSAHMFGRFIDSKKGFQLLRYGVFMNFVLFASKSIVTGAGGAVAVSTLGQPVLLAYKMPLVKGMYDAADEVEGYRIVYVAWMEVVAAMFKLPYALGILAASFYFDPITVVRVSFLFVPIIGLLMLTQNFPALKSKPVR